MQLGELQKNYSAFQAQGAEIIALAYQDVARALAMSQAVQAGYPILADQDHQVADAFGVFNLLQDNTATPSVFVIDQTGHITWSYIGRDANDRPAVAMLLQHLPARAP